MHVIYRRWAYNNVAIINRFNNIDWQIDGDQNLSTDAWYLLIANHQSWLDIIVLAGVAKNRFAEPKFFLKDSLKKVPFLGMGCWALDMPFMKRYSQAFLKKHPELKGKDIETTKKSCLSFKNKPTTIINFVEGTRFSNHKHQSQRSPFSHLLKPKAGGIAFTLAALGEQFDKVLNVTLLYPDNTKLTMTDVLKGKLTKVIVNIEQVPISNKITGDYFNDDKFKLSFQQWLNGLWQAKDDEIAQFYRQHQSKINHEVIVKTENKEKIYN